MRQILFRAKRIDNGEWIKGLLIKIGIVSIEDDEMTTDYVLGIQFLDKSYPIRPSTVCQYTGLTDKNGTMIWENDIIKMYYRDGESDIGVIKYKEDQARFLYYEDNIFAYGIDNTCTMEVIGNVFDNAELMKGE